MTLLHPARLLALSLFQPVALAAALALAAIAAIALAPNKQRERVGVLAAAFFAVLNADHAAWIASFLCVRSVMVYACVKAEARAV